MTKPMCIYRRGCDNGAACQKAGHCTSKSVEELERELPPSKELAKLVAELDQACYSARAERYGSVRIGLSEAFGILAALRTAHEPSALRIAAEKVRDHACSYGAPAHSLLVMRELIGELAQALGGSISDRPAPPPGSAHHLQDWRFVHRILVQARERLQANGERHTWLDIACDIADGRGTGPCSTATKRAQLSDDELREIWRHAGGRFHGPNIETGTMPEKKLLPFLRELTTPAASSQPPVPEPHVIKQIEHALQDRPDLIQKDLADYIRGCISDYRHALTKGENHG